MILSSTYLHHSELITFLALANASEMNRQTFVCITDANMCATLAAPTDGTRSSEDLTFPVDGTLTFSCNEGFTLTGSTTVTCQSDETFDDVAPTCGKSYIHMKSAC